MVGTLRPLHAAATKVRARLQPANATEPPGRVFSSTRSYPSLRPSSRSRCARSMAQFGTKAPPTIFSWTSLWMRRDRGHAGVAVRRSWAPTKGALFSLPRALANAGFSDGSGAAYKGSPFLAVGRRASGLSCAPWAEDWGRFTAVGSGSGPAHTSRRAGSTRGSSEPGAGPRELRRSPRRTRPW